MDTAELHERLAKLPIQPNPALVEQEVKRAESVQNRIADRITDFAGSMRFVYLHISGSASGSASGWRTTRSAC